MNAKKCSDCIEKCTDFFYQVASHDKKIHKRINALLKTLSVMHVNTDFLFICPKELCNFRFIGADSVIYFK